MQNCNSCGIEKKLSDFSLWKYSKNGIRATCKKCEYSKKVEYYKTKKGIVTKIYSNQLGNSKRRGHIPPTYTKQELVDWVYSQPKFHILYDNWKRLDYQKKYAPSVDRKDDYIGYTVDNIQLMTWGENQAKYSNQAKIGAAIGNHIPLKPVIKYDIDMNLLEEYISISEAARKNNMDKSDIRKCCNGKRKTAYGVTWRFKSE